MRITKAQLRDALESAARFNQLSLSFVWVNGPAYDEIMERIRNIKGFVPVCKYGRGMLPLRREIGTYMKTRYLLRG